jgi:hypothetical protein
MYNSGDDAAKMVTITALCYFLIARVLRGIGGRENSTSAPKGLVDEGE